MTRFQDVRVPGPLSALHCHEAGLHTETHIKKYRNQILLFTPHIQFMVPGVLNSGGGFKNYGVVDPHWLPCGSGSSFFYPNADPDPDPGNQNITDTSGSGSWSDFAINNY